MRRLQGFRSGLFVRLAMNTGVTFLAPLSLHCFQLHVSICFPGIGSDYFERRASSVEPALVAEGETH